MTTNTLRTIAVVLLLSLVSGCTAAVVPREPADVGGTVQAVERRDGDSGSFLVIGVRGEYTYDRARVSVTSDTVFVADGADASFSDLTEGADVEAWFTGPVAESYPVQATASHVRILGPE